MKFNKEEWTKKLKIEIGLSGVPDEQLKDYHVDFMQAFDSTENSNKKTAREYIDEQLLVIENEYKLLEESLAYTDIPEPSYINVQDTLLKPVQMTTSYTEMKYYRIQFPDSENTFIVIVPTNTPDRDSMIHFMENSPFTLGRVSSEITTGNEPVISYYQFVNRIQELAPINTRELLPVDHILANLATHDFDGGVDKNILDRLFYGNNG